MFLWRKKLKRVRTLIEQGDLNTATRLMSEFKLREYRGGQVLAEQLKNALADRSEHQIRAGDLANAWQDLSLADRWTVPQEYDQFTKQKNRLVELTIELAESHLANRQAMCALSLIAELRRRRILDRRADQIEMIAKRLQTADQLAAKGKLREASHELAQVERLRPDLIWIQQKQHTWQTQDKLIVKLTNKLRTAILDSRWSIAREVSGKLLDIAPAYQFAVDAIRRCNHQLRNRKQVSSQVINVQNNCESIDHNANQIRWIGNERTPPSTNCSSKGPQILISDTGCDSMVTESILAKSGACERLMLWVDGVGGFLLCTDNELVVGQAIPECRVDIPILGDLKRSHMRVQRCDDSHLITPIGPVETEGQTINAKTMLRNGQTLSLGGVQLRYSIPHPLSTSARLDITSRHRTQPWSDAILLVADTIVLGPKRNSHIVCPEWEHELILYRRKGDWFCRTSGNIEVDGQVFYTEAPLEPDCRISSEDCSMTLESIK